MNRIHSIIGMGVCVLLLMSAPTSASGKIYVSATGAKLQADKSASSQALETLSVGSALSVLSTSGSWYQVSTASGKKGWIYRGKVSKTPPGGSQSGQTSEIGNLMGSLGGSSINAGAADTSRSIRGLSPEAEEYAKQTNAPEVYRKALDDTLSIAVGENDIEKFLKEGGIGEYADAR